MKRDKLLYLLIFISILPVFILGYNHIINFYIYPDDLIWVFGSIMGMIGFILMFWQYLIGQRQFSKLFSYDYISINKAHKFVGVYGILIFLVHPTLLFIDYFVNKGINLIDPRIFTSFDLFADLGKIALVIYLVVWAASKLIRSKISFRVWKFIHLSNYIILPLVYLHADQIGTLFNSTSLELYIKILFGIFLLICIYRFFKQIGFLKYKYKVLDIVDITYDTKEIKFLPLGKKYITPFYGQFVDVQMADVLSETHPYTVSNFDDETHVLSIAIKNTGKYSDLLQNLSKDEVVYLDGPFGVFTKEMYFDLKDNMIIIAGGIGITPFLRFFDYVNKNNITFNNSYFFYGNKTIDDIGFKSILESSCEKSKINFINVLSGITEGNEKDSSFEKGFITSDLIKKYIMNDLKKYTFFICGPAIMMEKITTDLLYNGVNKKSIYKEEFSW